MRPTFIRSFAPTLAAIAFTAALLLAKWASAQEADCTRDEVLVTEPNGAQHISVHTTCVEKRGHGGKGGHKGGKGK